MTLAKKPDAHRTSAPPSIATPHPGNPMVPRVDFSAAEFDVAIYQKGYKVIWEQSMYCVCYDLESGQPSYNCPICGGKGYIYFDPVETRAVITSLKGTKTFEAIGMDERGTAYLTALSSDNVGFRDRFTLLDFATKHSELIIRGKYNDREDLLRYNSLAMLRVTDGKKVYKEGIDFVICRKHAIRWRIGVIPDGTPYSVLYDTRPIYITINPIHDIRGTYATRKGKGDEYFVPLPKQFQIRREDFVNHADL